MNTQMTEITLSHFKKYLTFQTYGLMGKAENNMPFHFFLSLGHNKNLTCTNPNGNFELVSPIDF